MEENTFKIVQPPCTLTHGRYRILSDREGMASSGDSVKEYVCIRISEADDVDLERVQEFAYKVADYALVSKGEMGGVVKAGFVSFPRQILLRLSQKETFILNERTKVRCVTPPTEETEYNFQLIVEGCVFSPYPPSIWTKEDAYLARNEAISADGEWGQSIIEIEGIKSGDILQHEVITPIKMLHPGPPENVTIHKDSRNTDTPGHEEDQQCGTGGSATIIFPSQTIYSDNDFDILIYVREGHVLELGVGFS